MGEVAVTLIALFIALLVHWIQKREEVVGMVSFLPCVYALGVKRWKRSDRYV